MGTYATTTSLDTLMVGITFNDEVNTMAGLVITQAENEVNKYLTKRYDVSAWATSTSVPPMVTTLTERLSMSELWANLGRGGKDSFARAKTLRENAIKCLEEIRDYKVDLVNTSGSAITDKDDASMEIQCNTSDYTETFAEDDVFHWSVDSDKLTDISNDRD